MPKRAASLSEKFDLTETRLILTGAQAVVRLALMQRKRDEQAGLRTAGYVTGYRGSPIAGIEAAFERARELCKSRNILFHPGLNEDLAATAVWGSQQAELRGEGRHDGVFAIWYGKGPGVDRAGDVFRHANHAGTSRHGGVIALLGDDHTCESSTSAHQSEFAMVDAMIPVLNPGGVQEILDYGLTGLALSRYAGVWVGLKCVKDNFESTATVDGCFDRVAISIPGESEYRMPPGGLNIRIGDQALAKEARLHEYKRDAIMAFARANGIDRLVISGGSAPRLGIVTTGKSYLDVLQALDELGIDEVAANALGLRVYKVGMAWPLEPQGIARFAAGLDTVMVVEEKRALIETQVKEALFDAPVRPRVIGKTDEDGRWLFPANGALEPIDIAIAMGERLARLGAGGETLKARVAELKRMKALCPEQSGAFQRTPYFCAGCPHNSSTVVPNGMRAYAGIGCHYMAQWMDRATDGFTQMGGEGANWIGEAPFSTRRHVFQNLGDGTYIHSGSLAIRAALAAGTNVTFKVLFNDAVAMTGGQRLDGAIGVPQIASQLLAEGVRCVIVVSDEPRKYSGRSRLPAGVRRHHRRDIIDLERELSETEGVTALIYDQTCAAEKRRRRKRGELPDPDRRIFINSAVCEGCGDCGRTSNCVAVVPLETVLGRKRAIDQSACNKDFSCVEGFCPSFVTLHGAKVRKSAAAGAPGDLGEIVRTLPDPPLPEIDRPFAIVVAGIGGTGVVTISAVLGQAAHIEGKEFGSIDMTGLAQKGGSVACHMRVARSPGRIHAIRSGLANADLIIGGDLVVAASRKILETIRPDKTAVVLSTYETTTGEFTRNPGLEVPGAALLGTISERVRRGSLHALDAHHCAERLLGDTIASNMILLGYAYQLGQVPIGSGAIEQAIALNGAAVAMNRTAFRLGRLAAHDRAALDSLLGSAGPARSSSETPEEIIAYRARHLAAYQDEQLAARFRSKVAWISGVEKEAAPGRSGLTVAVARAYHKLLAYKDEYEVARLFTDGSLQREIDAKFEGIRSIEFHFAPPFLARFHKSKSTGHPRKVRLGAWMLPVLRVLAKGKVLRGRRWDPFGHSAERRLERQMIASYEDLLDAIAANLHHGNHALAVQLAELPLEIKGFGHVKLACYKAAKRREADLWQAFTRAAPAVQAAAE